MSESVSAIIKHAAGMVRWGLPQSRLQPIFTWLINKVMEEEGVSQSKARNKILGAFANEHPEGRSTQPTPKAKPPVAEPAPEIRPTAGPDPARFE